MNESTAAIREHHDYLVAHPEFFDCDEIDEAHKDRGILLGMLEVAQDTIDKMEYRHECLKMMWDDEVNNITPDTADKDIDTYICEQELHQ